MRIKSLLAAALLAPAVWAQSPETLSAEDKADILQSMERTLKEFAFVPGVDFSKIPEMIGRQQDSLNAAGSPDAFAASVNRALSEFGFSHIVFFPPSFGEQRATQQRPGIGVRVLIQETGLRVTDVFPGSPADKSGLKPGDLITLNGDKQVRSTADLRGELGETSTLTIVRLGTAMPVDVTRANYSTVLPETLEEMAPDTAVLKIPTFDQGYDRARIDGLMEKAAKYPNLIIDLRSNGGGRVVNLQHFMSHFIDREQPLGTFIGKGEAMAFEKANGRSATIEDLVSVAESTTRKVRAFARSDRYAGKLSVLVGPATGSASEMAAAALKTHRSATLIGAKSAGAVLASMMMPLQNGKGFWIQYPVTDYVTIEGRRLEGQGVMPDIEIDVAAYSDRGDETVLAAVSLMKTALPPAGRTSPRSYNP